ncbi:MAG: Omp28-related outer membrane protein [Bacteroidota bacterium]
MRLRNLPNNCSWVWLLGLVFFCACQENKPVIPPLADVEMETETEVETTDTLVRKVLIEEFTGVRCVNCPQGSAEVENLLAIHGTRLVAVGIHAGSFSQPYPESTIDFRTTAGDEIIDFLGVPLGYPSAVINRSLPDGRTRLQTGQSSWAGLIQQELDKEALLALAVVLDFDSSTRRGTADVELTATIDIDTDLRISVMVVETNIPNTQLTPSGKQDDYIHRHNLRTMLTNATGNALDMPLLSNVATTQAFNFTIPSSWKAEDISIVTFVHRNGELKEVLQVEETPLMP